MSFTVFESWWKQWQHFNTNHKWKIKKKRLKRLISFFFLDSARRGISYQPFNSYLFITNAFSRWQSSEVWLLEIFFFFLMPHDSVPTTFKSFWHLHSVRVKSKAAAFAFPPSHDAPEYIVKTEGQRPTTISLFGPRVLSYVLHLQIEAQSVPWFLHRLMCRVKCQW